MLQHQSCTHCNGGGCLPVPATPASLPRLLQLILCRLAAIPIVRSVLIAFILGLPVLDSTMVRLLINQRSSDCLASLPLQAGSWSSSAGPVAAHPPQPSVLALSLVATLC